MPQPHQAIMAATCQKQSFLLILEVRYQFEVGRYPLELLLSSQVKHRHHISLTPHCQLISVGVKITAQYRVLLGNLEHTLPGS